ncbi:MAG: apolipoprotein N-acyltransferase [Acidimicrobiia bacterium]
MPALAALASALLLWAAFPPLGWGLLVFVAPAPLLWGLRREISLSAALGSGLLFGLAFFGALLSWIRFAALIAWVALTLVLALYPTLYAGGLWLARRWPAAWWWVAATGGWSLMELVRGRFPLGGFPWGMLGYPVGELAWPRGATQWIGTSGWSVIVVGVAAGLALGASRGVWRWAGASAAVALALVVGGALRPPLAEGPSLRVAIVQGNAPCPGLACQGERERIFESHLRLTASLRPGTVDLVVWPESSTGFASDPVLNPGVGELIAEQARRLGAFVLVGSDRPLGEAHFLNTNVVFTPAGLILDEYAKQQPVPFGEYVPLRDFLDFIPELEQVPRDMVPGPGPVVFRLPNGVLGSVISYEGGFARLVRQEVRAGAQAMVVATNEATFGRSPASDQFIGMTRMRAAESGMFLVHAAVTGKSAFIEPDGAVGPRTGLYTAEVLRDEIRFRTGGPTLYVRFGDWLQLAAVAVMLGAVIRRGKERWWRSTTARKGM